MYVFAQPFRDEQGQFLSGVQKGVIQIFSFPRLVAEIKLKKSAYPTIYL